MPADLYDLISYSWCCQFGKGRMALDDADNKRKHDLECEKYAITPQSEREKMPIVDEQLVIASPTLSVIVLE